MQQKQNLLISRISDAIDAFEQQGVTSYLGFFNEDEISDINEYLKVTDFSDYTFCGGYENAVRQMLCIGEFNFNKFPVTILCFNYRKCDILCHRDFLGALMSLGIRREALGDILVGEGIANVFVKEEIADYIISQTFKIGNKGVRVKKSDKISVDIHEQTDDIILTASSLRIDNIIAKLCSLSRSDAAKLILSECVSINHCAVKNNDVRLKENDVITIRKKGKYIFIEILGFSKKGKFKILMKHFR